MIISTFGQSESPGNEQRFYWGSASADKPGSRNYIGIKNKAIDALIDKIIFAKDRDELVTVTKALDRVLLFNHFVVPNWYSASERIAYWNRFSQPTTKPTRSIGYVQTWWYDAEKAKLVKAGGKKSAELK
jgi:microcin C transport system substrate-binding protein